MGGQNFPFSAMSQSQTVKTISIFSLRGGVGKTTLAANLAIGLAQLGKGGSCLVDLALDTLHCSLLLDLRPKNYLTNLVDWPGQGLNKDEVEDLLCKHASGVDLLPAAENPQEAELLTPQMLDMVWEHLEQAYAYLVVDAGSHFDDFSLSAMERSDLILLVFSPDLASLKSTTDALTVFKEIGIPDNKILLVANWVFPANPLLLKRIIPALKLDLAAEIPYEPLGVGKALNTGHPLLVETPQSPVAQVIRGLSRTLSEIRVES